MDRATKRAFNRKAKEMVQKHASLSVKETWNPDGSVSRNVTIDESNPADGELLLKMLDLSPAETEELMDKAQGQGQGVEQAPPSPEAEEMAKEPVVEGEQAPATQVDDQQTIRDRVQTGKKKVTTADADKDWIALARGMFVAGASKEAVEAELRSHYVAGDQLSTVITQAMKLVQKKAAWKDIDGTSITYGDTVEVVPDSESSELNDYVGQTLVINEDTPGSGQDIECLINNELIAFSPGDVRKVGAKKVTADEEYGSKYAPKNPIQILYNGQVMNVDAGGIINGDPDHTFMLDAEEWGHSEQDKLENLGTVYNSDRPEGAAIVYKGGQTTKGFSINEDGEVVDTPVTAKVKKKAAVSFDGQPIEVGDLVRVVSDEMSPSVPMGAVFTVSWTGKAQECGQAMADQFGDVDAIGGADEEKGSKTPTFCPAQMVRKISMKKTARMADDPPTVQRTPGQTVEDYVATGFPVGIEDDEYLRDCLMEAGFGDDEIGSYFADRADNSGSNLNRLAEEQEYFPASEAIYTCRNCGLPQDAHISGDEGKLICPSKTGMKKKAELQVGDEVEITYEPEKGQTGTISRIDGDKYFLEENPGVDVPGGAWYYATDLDKIGMKKKAESSAQYLQTFFQEKQLTPQSWEIEGNDGYTHFIDSDVVIEAIMGAPENEQQGIADMIRKIDFANGDVNKYLEHLAKGLVNMGQPQEASLKRRGPIPEIELGTLFG